MQKSADFFPYPRVNMGGVLTGKIGIYLYHDVWRIKAMEKQQEIVFRQKDHWPGTHHYLLLFVPFPGMATRVSRVTRRL